MTFAAVATLIVLIVAFVLFLTEALPVDLTALLIPVALGVLGVLEPKEALAGFGHPAVITVAGMFVLSRALVASGAVGALGSLLKRVARGGERRALLAIAVLVAVGSAFINNTPVVMVFLPLVLAIAADLDLAPSRLLMPMAYASIMGGCCTVIGTSTTVLVSAELPAYGQREIGFFEPAAFGLVILVVGVLYLVVIGPRVLPIRRTVASSLAGRPAEYVTEVMVGPGSPFLGKTLVEALVQPHPEIRVIELVRGAEILWPQAEDLRVQEGDLILVRGRAEELVSLGTHDGSELLPELKGQWVRGRDVTLAELVIPRTSPLVGRSVREAMNRAIHGAGVMAVQRRGAHLRRGLPDLILREGDTLLVQTESSRLPSLRESEDFLLLEGLHEDATLKRRAPLVVGVTLLVVLLASLDLVDIAFLAIAAAVLLVATRSITLLKAYRALDFSTLVLMGGTLALGTALERSGIAAQVTEGMAHAAQAALPEAFRATALLAGCWLLTSVLTSLVSNTAAAVLVLPVAIQSATAAGADARPFIMAVVYAASIAFATPTGYQTNLLVFGPGGYRFTDFVRVGLPLQALMAVVGIIGIPFVFPF